MAVREIPQYLCERGHQVSCHTLTPSPSGHSPPLSTHLLTASHHFSRRSLLGTDPMLASKSVCDRLRKLGFDSLNLNIDETSLDTVSRYIFNWILLFVSSCNVYFSDIRITIPPKFLSSNNLIGDLFFPVFHSLHPHISKIYLKYYDQEESKYTSYREIFLRPDTGWDSIVNRCFPWFKGDTRNCTMEVSVDDIIIRDNKHIEDAFGVKKTASSSSRSETPTKPLSKKTAKFQADVEEQTITRRHSRTVIIPDPDAIRKPDKIRYSQIRQTIGGRRSSNNNNTQLQHQEVQHNDSSEQLGNTLAPRDVQRALDRLAGELYPRPANTSDTECTRVKQQVEVAFTIPSSPRASSQSPRAPVKATEVTTPPSPTTLSPTPTSNTNAANLSPIVSPRVALSPREAPSKDLTPTDNVKTASQHESTERLGLLSPRLQQHLAQASDKPRRVSALSNSESGPISPRVFAIDAPLLPPTPRSSRIARRAGSPPEASNVSDQTRDKDENDSIGRFSLPATRISIPKLPSLAAQSTPLDSDSSDSVDPPTGSVASSGQARLQISDSSSFQQFAPDTKVKKKNKGWSLWKKSKKVTSPGNDGLSTTPKQIISATTAMSSVPFPQPLDKDKRTVKAQSDSASSSSASSQMFLTPTTVKEEKKTKKKKKGAWGLWGSNKSKSKHQQAEDGRLHSEMNELYTTEWARLEDEVEKGQVEMRRLTRRAEYAEMLVQGYEAQSEKLQQQIKDLEEKLHSAQVEYTSGLQKVTDELELTKKADPQGWKQCSKEATATIQALGVKLTEYERLNQTLQKQLVSQK